MTTTVDGYLEALSEPMQRIGKELRSLVDAGLPDADGVMWHG